MILKSISYGTFFFFAVTLISSCKKDTITKNENGQVVVQGNIILKVRATHHWWGVSYLPVYLKKNATGVWFGPDSSKYEFQTTTDNDGNCQFDHLFPGSYNIYAHGLDPFFGMFVIGYDSIHLNAAAAPGNERDYTLTVSE